ncbi:MAG: serine aminopeptidase domain-containing protein [Caulobacteraceae bacterium]
MQPFLDSRIPPGLNRAAYPPDGWAWGVLEIPGAPPSRYGVSAPPYKPEGQVLILPGYGESAETWFETARDLNRRGQVVWILDGVAQGGSGRYVAPRDVGHLKPGEANVAAIKRMGRIVVRERPLTVLASGSAAAPALLAAETGARIDRLVISGPDVPAPGKLQKPWREIASRAFGGPWKRDDSPPSGPGDPARIKAAREWQIANPDLRMGGPSQGWMAAYARTSQKAREGLLHISAAMMVLADRDESALCRRVAHCQAVIVPGATGKPHLARDPARSIWLEAFAGKPDPNRAVFADSPLEARVDR